VLVEFFDVFFGVFWLRRLSPRDDQIGRIVFGLNAWRLSATSTIIVLAGGGPALTNKGANAKQPRCQDQGKRKREALRRPPRWLSEPITIR